MPKLRRILVSVIAVIAVVGLFAIETAATAVALEAHVIVDADASPSDCHQCDDLNACAGAFAALRGGATAVACGATWTKAEGPRRGALHASRVAGMDPPPPKP